MRSQGGHVHPTSISEPNKPKSFSFKYHGYCFLRMFRNSTGPKISQFLRYMLQFFDDLWRFFIFSNYIREIDHFTWTIWKGPILNAGSSEKFLF